MPLKVPIPGLSKYINDIPDGSLIHVEGGVEYVKSAFALHIACGSSERGWMPFIVTTRWLEDLRSEVSAAHPKKAFDAVSSAGVKSLASAATPNRILVVDSFSYMWMQSEVGDFMAGLEELRTACKSTGCITLLVSESGVMGDAKDAAVAQMADCIVQFLSREGQDRVARFIRIPKWAGGISLGENLYYDYDGRRINIDLRARVV